MSLDMAVAALTLGASISVALAAWLYNRRRPKVDPDTLRHSLDMLHRGDITAFSINGESYSVTYADQPKRHEPPPTIPAPPMLILEPGPPAEDNPCPHENTAEIRNLCDPIGIYYCTDCGKDIKP